MKFEAKMDDLKIDPKEFDDFSEWAELTLRAIADEHERLWEDGKNPDGRKIGKGKRYKSDAYLPRGNKGVASVWRAEPGSKGGRIVKRAGKDIKLQLTGDLLRSREVKQLTTKSGGAEFKFMRGHHSGKPAGTIAQHLQDRFEFIFFSAADDKEIEARALIEVAKRADKAITPKKKR